MAANLEISIACASCETIQWALWKNRSEAIRLSGIECCHTNMMVAGSTALRALRSDTMIIDLRTHMGSSAQSAGHVTGTP